MPNGREAGIHWRIHRLELGADRRPVPGDVVAEVRTADGAGTLEIFDPKYEETLRSLFEEEQFVFTTSEEDEAGSITDSGEILKPWEPRTLAHVRDRLRLSRLVAVPVYSP